jgi:hypothetical protein
MPLKSCNFTVRVAGENPHRRGSNNWCAGQIVEAMEGCHIRSIISALSSFEENRTVGVADPARWLTHFSGLATAKASKSISPWVEIIFEDNLVTSKESYRKLVKKECA